MHDSLRLVWLHYHIFLSHSGGFEIKSASRKKRK